MKQPRRLSPLDRIFLDLDTAETPQQVGWVIRFDGDPPSLDELREHIEPRLIQLPLFKMRIGRSKRRLGGPCWSTVSDFSIADHIGAATATTGNADPLSSLASRLLSQRLDRARPLWRMWLVNGLAEGWAVIGHGHHALMDGIAAVEVAGLLLDPLSSPTGRRGVDSRKLPPSAQPSPRRKRRRTKGRMRRLIRGARMMILRGPRTPLDDAGSGNRSIGLGMGDLTAVKAVARSHGATANDALLAATSRALTADLHSRGKTPAWIKVLMPFRLYNDARGRASGNEIAAVTVKLPLGELGLDELLTTTALRTKDAKALGNSGLIEILARGVGVIPGPLRTAITRWVYRRLHFNIIVSSLRGPPGEYGLLDRPAIAIHPLVPVTQGQGVSIGAMSYRGRLWLGVNANAQLLDAPLFTQRIERALNDL